MRRESNCHNCRFQVIEHREQGKDKKQCKVTNQNCREAWKLCKGISKEIKIESLDSLY